MPGLVSLMALQASYGSAMAPPEAGEATKPSSNGVSRPTSFAYSQCLGGDGPASLTEFGNLHYIDRTVRKFAPELNTISDGTCTMQPSRYSTIDDRLATVCANGNLRISTSAQSNQSKV